MPELLCKFLKTATLSNLRTEIQAYGTEFVSTNEVITFDIVPGEYILHEKSAPTGFNAASDITFKVDAEGISYVKKNNQYIAVSHVEMTDTAKYKVIFHENNTASYRLQYNGSNVNGVDTTGNTQSAENDYRYITNVDCTSKQKSTADSGVVKWDHKNFDDYIFFTLFVIK